MATHRRRTVSIQASGPDPDYHTLCQRLMTDVEQRLRREIEVEDKFWQMGQTRLFMKDKIERHCERLLVERSKTHVTTLQRRWRGFVQRKEFLTKQASVPAVQSAVRIMASHVSLVFFLCQFLAHLVSRTCVHDFLRTHTSPRMWTTDGPKSPQRSLCVNARGLVQNATRH